MSVMGLGGGTSPDWDGCSTRLPKSARGMTEKLTGSSSEACVTLLSAIVLFLLELVKHALVVLVKQADVGNVVLEHGHAGHAQAEGKAAVLAGRVASELED